MSQVQLSDSDFAKLVRQANLEITPKEADEIKSQLDEALNAVQVLRELDTSAVPPLDHPGNLTNVTRPDVVTPSLTQSEALENAPESYQGFVMVPGVLESES